MPPGRKLGLGGVQGELRHRQELARRGQQISAEKARQMKLQLESFKQKLEEFAIRHKKEIQRDPAFRAKFHAMCASIGVDPLTSRKGVWSELLGVGDYYYELGVRIIEVCVSTRPMNGGIISLNELVDALGKRRVTYTEKISSDDVERAVKKLGALGNGFKIVQTGSERIVQSVPMELSRDHTMALGVCRDKGYTTSAELQRSTGWNTSRVQAVLQFLLQNEFAWIDRQAQEETFWIMGMLAGGVTET